MRMRLTHRMELERHPKLAGGNPVPGVRSSTHSCAKNVGMQYAWSGPPKKENKNVDLRNRRRTKVAAERCVHAKNARSHTHERQP